MDFLKDQLPLAVAHGAGAYAGYMLGERFKASVPEAITIASGVYVGCYAYNYATSEGSASYSIRQDTMGSMAGAVAGFYFPFLGDKGLSVATGAVIGDIVASYVLGWA